LIVEKTKDAYMYKNVKLRCQLKKL